MKWIKTAIGAVIAISIIPLVVLSAINIKKSLEKEKITVTTYLNYYSGFNWEDRYDLRFAYPYLKWSEYINNGFTVTHLYDHTHDINITITDWDFSRPYNKRIIDNNGVWYEFYSNTLYISKTYDSIYGVMAKDIVLIDITFARTKVNLAAILISFVPIIFVGGVVLYSYKLFKKD